MDYEVNYSDEAQDDLDKLSPKLRNQIEKKAANMRKGHFGDLKKLEGTSDAYRIFSGDFRILFTMEGASATIFGIRNRKDAYK